MMIANKKIIFFDGVCNLCNGFIDYVIKRDVNKNLFYASLQSEIAREALHDQNIIIKEDYTTIYYLANGKLYSQSSAILNIFLELSIKHKILAKLSFLIPRFIRDFLYKIIAKNRYRLFGKKESCRLPSPEERSQFI